VKRESQRSFLNQAIHRYSPRGDSKGTILVLSDNRLLNHMHGEILSTEGYTVYTGITLTDALAIICRLKKTRIDVVLVASKIYGWHGREGEKRLEAPLISPDQNWESGNIATLIQQINQKQQEIPYVLIAYDLIHSPWYKITKRGLAKLGLEFARDYHTYFASNPYSAIEHFEKARNLKKEGSRKK